MSFGCSPLLQLDPRSVIMSWDQAYDNETEENCLLDAAFGGDGWEDFCASRVPTGFERPSKAMPALKCNFGESVNAQYAFGLDPEQDLLADSAERPLSFWDFGCDAEQMLESDMFEALNDPKMPDPVPAVPKAEQASESSTTSSCWPGPNNLQHIKQESESDSLSIGDLMGVVPDVMHPITRKESFATVPQLQVAYESSAVEAYAAPKVDYAHDGSFQSQLMLPHQVRDLLPLGPDTSRMTQARLQGLERYRAKKARRFFTKKIRYQLRKINADKRPRVKGRFVKKDQILDPSDSPASEIVSEEPMSREDSVGDSDMEELYE